MKVPDPTRQTTARVKTPAPAEVDVAIVGAGLGGLMSGALLAKQGLRVAIFDGHYVAGGCATMFTRGRGEDRYVFDIGLHYIGECGPDGRIPKMLDRVGVKLDFVPMDPDGFDTIVLPGLRFPIPADRELYRDRLIEHFPKEKKGIDRYVRFLREVDVMFAASEQRRSKWGLLWDGVTRGRLALRYKDATMAQLLDDVTADPLLRGVILGQNGDYGLPPSKVSSMVHAGLANHYFRGAFYPKGGGQQIADALADVVEAAGGAVCLRRTVEQIVVEGGRAVGVRVRPQRGESQEVRAKIVISNADLRHTVRDLLPREALPADWLKTADGWEMAGAIFITCLGVKMDLAAAGMRRTNYWVFNTLDIEQVYGQVDGGGWSPHCAYITSASMKDPETHGHAPDGVMSVESMTLAPGAASFWGVSPETIARGGYRQIASYRERKHQIEEAMIDRLDELFPGARAAVVFRESATPLTHIRYTGASEGSAYGIAATPAQFLENRPSYRGPIPGLFFAGANTRSGHGVSATMRSGVNAARRVAAELDRPLVDP